MTDREKLIALLRVPIYPREGVDPAECVADYLLDMGVVVRERGEWKFDSGVDYSYKCSRCGEEIPPHYNSHNFCPNCGADMRKGENG